MEVGIFPVNSATGSDHCNPKASTTYGAVANTIRYLADRSEQPRPIMLEVEYNFPLTHAQIIDLFHSKIREAKQQYPNTRFTDVPPLSVGSDLNDEQKKNKIVVVIDAITANPGALMPWQEMCKIASEEGVWTVIDAAHSIGQEVYSFDVFFFLSAVVTARPLSQISTWTRPDLTSGSPTATSGVMQNEDALYYTCPRGELVRCPVTRLSTDNMQESVYDKVFHPDPSRIRFPEQPSIQGDGHQLCRATRV